ncbi:MAG: flavodoxin FldA [Odoribacteraceae bacterium]|jgi:flavodoxin I|nr:flavodoxin FldA [Odoribacteraceae bacterium]
MKKMGIFYGSTTGTTENVAGVIAEKLGISQEDIYNVATTRVEVVDGYDLLILGSSTWGVGELQDDWYDFLDGLKKKNLSGKRVALFGCGDSTSFGSSFCDALGIIHGELQGSGCQFIGAVEDQGYAYEASAALVDGQFVGLPLDDGNEGHLTEARVDAWIGSLQGALH